MRRLKISDRDMMRIAIQQEINRSEEARYDHRLHGVLLVSQGLSCYEVAELLGQAPTTIQRWVNRFEKDGFGGIQEKDRPGRPGRIDGKICDSLEEDLRRSPRHFGYGQNLWDGKVLSVHLQRAYQTRLGVRQCQRLFGQMGFRRRKPRPLIAKANPAAQRAFKKTSSTYA